MKISRSAALLLSLAVTLGTSVPHAAATGGTEMKVTKTNIQAQSVANNEGYASINMAASGTDQFGNPLKQSALVDRTGKFVVPYTVHTDGYTEYQFSYGDGYIAANYGVLPDYLSTESTYLKPDGSPTGIKLPDLAESHFSNASASELKKPEYLVSPFSDGVAIVNVRQNATGYYLNPTIPFIIDQDGNVLAELPDEIFGLQAEPLHFTTTYTLAGEGLIGVKTDYQEAGSGLEILDISKRYYMDYSGNIVLDLTDRDYRDIGLFSNGFAWVVESVENGGLCGYIDHDGSQVIPSRYTTVYAFQPDGKAAAAVDGQFGVIDQSGNPVIPFQYESSYGYADGYLTVGEGGKYGLVDLNNNVVVPMIYDDISTFENGIGYAIKDGYLYLITDQESAAPIAYSNTQTVRLDGAEVVLQAYALRSETGGTTNYVKLRDIASLLSGTKAQFEVAWDGNVNIITGQPYTSSGLEMTTPFSGDRPYYVPKAVTKINGVPCDLDAIGLRDDEGGGYTYYQLRQLGKALGFNVGWDAQTGIFIETDQPYSDAD